MRADKQDHKSDGGWGSRQVRGGSSGPVFGNDPERSRTAERLASSIAPTVRRERRRVRATVAGSQSL